LNAAILRKAGQMSRYLGFCGDGMEDVNAADAAMLDERPDSPGDGFYFR
jgi:hypothetical protein